MKGYTNHFEQKVRPALGAILGALSCVLSIAACSVEAGSAAAPTLDFPAPQTATKAMAADGAWVSNCYYSQGNYLKETMNFKENTVTVTVDVFSFSSSCSGTPNSTANVQATMYRAGSSFWVQGGHDVEVTTTLADGTTKMQRTVFLIEGTVLYVSDSDLTSAGKWPYSVDRTRPYRRVGG